MMERSSSQEDTIIESNLDIIDFISKDTPFEDLENILSSQPVVKTNNSNFGFSWNIAPSMELKSKSKKRKLGSAKCIFDKEENKFYTSMDTIFSIQYQVERNPKKCKDTYFIRLTPMFKEISQRSIPLERCPHHCQGDNLPERSVLIIHPNQPEYYQLVSNSNHNQICLLVPFSFNRDERQICCSFKCYNSCPGGIERRATLLTLSFERKNPEGNFEVLSQSTFEFKSSASVSRDSNSRPPKEEEMSHEPFVKFRNKKFFMLAVDDLSTYRLLQVTRDHVLQKSNKRSVRTCQHVESCVSKRMKNEDIQEEEGGNHPKITPQSEWVVMSSQGSSQGSSYCPGPISLLKNEGIEEITIKRNSLSQP